MKKTYYQQLKPIVLGIVEHYRTDFTVHDRKYLTELQKTKGAFIISFGKMGTSFYNFGGEEEPLNDAERIKHTEAMIAWMTTSNKFFIHGNNGAIKLITKKEAKKLITENINTYPSK